jgi:hypothetical protein
VPYEIPDAPTGVDADAWAATVAEVRAFCGWHIAPEVTETITRDGSGGPVIVLPTLRLVDLVSITNDGTELVDPEWSASGMVYAGTWSRWTPKFRGVVAEITHGFEEWPAELLSVMAEMAGGGASSEWAGVKAVASGPHQVTFETTSVSSASREVLGRYQLPFLA